MGGLFYAYISQGLWTKPVNLGARVVGWPASEVSKIINARIAGKEDAKIRELVIEMEVNRKILG
ncbi:MAG: transcriptional regulator [Deltaproteobacteria bacterium]|nr:transcriptional regulator [Deltaproteobacteria bacterium]